MRVLRRAALGVVVGQQALDRAAAGQAPGQVDRVQDRLAGAVGADRVHRVRGVAQKGDAPERPLGQWVAVAHRVDEHIVGAADQRRQVERIGQECDAASLIVHHVGKDEGSGARGSYALLGDMDAQLQLSVRKVGSAQIHYLSSPKQKDHRDLSQYC